MLGERGKQWVVQHAPEVRCLSSTERFMLLPRTDQIMLGVIPDFRQTWPEKLAAAGASRSCVKSWKFFRGAKVGAAQCQIRSNYTNQSDVPLEIVSLRHHLRADEDVDFAARESAEHLLIFTLGSHRVAVEPRDARLRKLFAQIFLDALGAIADEKQILGFAFRALLRRTNRVAGGRGTPGAGGSYDR